MRARAIYSTLIVSILGVVVWLYTPVPTSVARAVWERWQMGDLALLLDTRDAKLAFTIGSYYFGNQFATSTTAVRPYDLPRAKIAFTKAIQINSAMPLAHYMRARVEFIQSDFISALADLNAEIVLTPENKRSLYMRGLTYTYRGLPNDLARAEQDFKDFVAWAPREWAGYNDLAYVLAKEKQYQTASTVLTEGIAKALGGETNPWLWNALGVMEMNTGNIDKAIIALEKAQDFASTLSDADWQRAYPGNNPANARGGSEAMRLSIARNIITAYTTKDKK